MIKIDKKEIEMALSAERRALIRFIESIRDEDLEKLLNSNMFWE